MKVTGIMAVFVDVPPGKELEFNRWCDLDHVAEMCAVDGVIDARRYHAEDAIMRFRADKLENAPPIGQARYCTLYFLGNDPPATAARMKEASDRLRGQGRGLATGRPVHTALYRLVQAYASPRIKATPDALPHLGHQALQVAMGYAPKGENIADAAEWWHSIQYPAMLSVPGWAAALRCEPAGEEGRGRFLHLFLLDEPAASAHQEFEAALAGRLAGRTRHPRGAYQRTFSGPFTRITPARYDFLSR
jgi:hypothetical protein